MEYKEVKTQPVKELNKKVYELKKDLFDLEMKNSLGQLSNPLKIRFLRKDIARVMTALTAQASVAPKTAAPKASEKIVAKKTKSKKV